MAASRPASLLTTLPLHGGSLKAARCLGLVTILPTIEFLRVGAAVANSSQRSSTLFRLTGSSSTQHGHRCHVVIGPTYLSPSATGRRGRRRLIVGGDHIPRSASTKHGRRCHVAGNDHIPRSAPTKHGQRCHVVIGQQILQVSKVGAGGGASLLVTSTFHRVLPPSTARGATLL